MNLLKTLCQNHFYVGHRIEWYIDIIWNFYLWFGFIQCSPVMDLSNIYLVEYRVMDFKRHQESRTIGWSNDNISCICFIIWRNFRFSLITISTRPVICAQTLSPTRCSVPKVLTRTYILEIGISTFVVFYVVIFVYKETELNKYKQKLFEPSSTFLFDLKSLS